MQLAVTRALFQLQSGGRELTSNSSERRRVFRQLLLRGKEIPSPDDAQLHGEGIFPLPAHELPLSL